MSRADVGFGTDEIRIRWTSPPGVLMLRSFFPMNASTSCSPPRNLPSASGTSHRFGLRALHKLVLCFAMFLASGLARAVADEVENPPDVAGFRGEVVGVVKSAKSDGSGFVLTVEKAKFDLDASKLKDNAPLIGKELGIGVRMPKTNGESHQHPADLAYVKSLKPGDVIAVKIFSVVKNPRLLRIQEPGHPAGDAAAGASK
jgi:hypothetical protein